MKWLFRFLRSLRFGYRHLAEAVVYRDRLIHNYKVFSDFCAPVSVAPVLKSNAYGHGLVQVAEILDKQSPPFFVVDGYHEALILRNEGIRSPILVIGYTLLENINGRSIRDTSFTITGIDELAKISKNLKKTRAFHLKIDTGMRRQGILPKEVSEAVRLIRANPKIVLEGICSHFSDADGADETYSARQIQEWNEIARSFRRSFTTIRFAHIAATAGTHFTRSAEGNVCRVGLGIYGIDPHPSRSLLLKPALEVKTIIGSLKTIEKGDEVGYGRTFHAEHSMRIATIPLGYADCVDRRLSNIGFVRIGSAFCPIIGRVSMNITTIDVSGAPDAKHEDEVIVVSAAPEDKNSVSAIAKACGTIPYDILVHISPQLRRTVVS